MIRNERVWSGTKSNTVNVHAFISGVNRPAVCNSRIKAGSETLLNMNEREATTLPTTYCAKCETAVLAMVNRREASMQPSTGEGDHLPPAAPVQPDGKRQCMACFGDYAVNSDGQMRLHDCARYSKGVWTYGPRDRKGRAEVSLAPAPAGVVSVTEVQDEVVVKLAEPVRTATREQADALMARIRQMRAELDAVESSVRDMTYTDDEQQTGRWSVTNPPFTMSTRIEGLRLIQGGAKLQCESLTWGGDRCGLDAGHKSDCMH